MQEPANIPPLSSSPPSPGLLHMKGAAQGQLMVGGVCAMRGPQTQTQHTAPQATTAGLECDLLQIFNARIRPWMFVSVKCKCGERDVDGGMSATECHMLCLHRSFDEVRACWVLCLQQRNKEQ